MGITWESGRRGSEANAGKGGGGGGQRGVAAAAGKLTIRGWEKKTKVGDITDIRAGAPPRG